MYINKPYQNKESILTLLDASPAMLWMTEPGSYCTYLSKRWYQYTGRTPEQDLGYGWLELVHPDDQQNVKDTFFTSTSKQKVFHSYYRILRHDGEYRWVLDSGSPHFDNMGNYLGYVGTVIDIHEQKQVENSLKQAQNRFELVANATGLGVWYCNFPCQEHFWNAKAKEHFWLPPNAEINNDIFYAHIHPDDRGIVKKSIDNAIKNRAPYDVQYRTINPSNNKEFKWIRAIGWTDGYNKENLPNRFDGITLDISSEKKVNSNLHTAVQTRDEFLSIASHELKTPLTSLKLQTQLAKLILSSPQNISNFSTEKMCQMVEKMERSINRISRFVDDILDISRITTGKLTLLREKIDLSLVVRDVVDRLSPLFLKSGNSIFLDTPSGTLGHWDPVRLEQVITNLLTNASRYGKQKPIYIKVKKIDNYAELRIKDEGYGIDKTDHERIFQRFERGSSHNEANGLGLGLYIVKEIINMHGGVIRVDSEPGKGAEFITLLPI